MSTPNRIQQLQKQRNRLLKQLLAVDLMIPGAFKVVHRKCGKPNCWCRDQLGHPLRRITWSDQGVSRSKAIPQAQVSWIKKVTNNYREFRHKRRQIQRMDSDIKKLLDVHEQEVVRKSRELKGYR